MVTIILLFSVPVVGLAFGLIFNVRGVGVRYIRWQRNRRAARGRHGIARLHTTRGTRIVAAATGLVWLVVDGGAVVVVIRGALN